MIKLEEDIIIKKIKKDIKEKKKKIIVPEGDEIRVIKSLKYTPEIIKILLGEENEILNLIKTEYPENYNEIIAKVEIVEPKNYCNEDRIQQLLEIRKGKLEYDQAKDLLCQNPYIAMMMLYNGEGDAVVGGSYYSTADILRPSLQIIKTKPGTKIASSCFIMKKEDKTVLFADCALNVNPTAEEIKEIALQTLETAQELNIDPKVAFLTYSTKGSGSGESVEKMQKAYSLLIEEYPEFKNMVDGEFQFDAAYAQRVGKIKAPDSPVSGQANVFIFPNLEAGNIGYKIAEYMGDWSATGPIIQGLNKRVNDLSRGTTPEVMAQIMYLSLR